MTHFPNNLQALWRVLCLTLPSTNGSRRHGPAPRRSHVRSHLSPPATVTTPGLVRSTVTEDWIGWGINEEQRIGQFVDARRQEARTIVLLMAVSLGTVFLAAQALKVAVATRLADSGTVEGIRHAIVLDPMNPEYHHRLGKLLSFAVGSVPSAGIGALRRAVELNPRNSYYWLDLGKACEGSDDKVCADEAFENAAQRSPATPHFHWAAGNHHLRMGHVDLALKHFHRLLELDPGYANATFHICLGVLRSPERIRDVLPSGKNPRLTLAFAEFLSAQGDFTFAQQLWKSVVSDGIWFPFSMVEGYLEHLVKADRAEEVSDVWRDLQRLGVIGKAAITDPDNLVFNGSFEQDPLNAGLDWRHKETPYLSVDFGDPTAYDGKRSLRVDFTVRRNDEFLIAYQFIPVAPNHSYALTFQTRSESITSDSGPLLRVRETNCASCPGILSDVTTGTTPWHEVKIRFSTGPHTTLINLSLLRLRSRTFPMDITGTFWLDDLRLRSGGYHDSASLQAEPHQSHTR